MSEGARLLESATALYRQNQLQSAEARLRSALAIDRQSIDANLLLGIILVRTQRATEAVGYLRSVLGQNPHQWDALTWLAHCNRMQGNLGAAAELFERATLAEPGNPEGYQNLGRSLASMNSVADGYRAAEAFKQAIAYAPRDLTNYVELYRLLDTLGEWEQARTYLSKGHSISPSTVALTVLLAKAAAKVRDEESAERLFREALALDPRTGAAYALWLQETGRFEESVTQLTECIAKLPAYGLAYYYLAEANAFDLEGASLLDRVRQVERMPGIEPPSAMYLEYAKAKALEKQGLYEDSIRSYDKANAEAYRLFNSDRPYDVRLVRDFLRRSEKLFSPEFLRDQESFGLKSAQPIFIVGMIRSGTTLLDQLLTWHPDIASAGEIPYWIQVGELATAQLERDDHSSEALKELGDEYLKRLSKVAGASPRIIDKMPANYQYLGLIHTVFPNAKILHMRRSPLDTCLSIYTTQFGGGVPFAHCKRNIVDQYRSYLDTMAHWREILRDNVVLQIDYEDLIADQATTLRRVFRFLDLDSDVSVEAPRRAATIMTPSRWQARQPVYSSSIERWRRFEPWLGELMELRDASHQ